MAKLTEAAGYNALARIETIELQIKAMEFALKDSGDVVGQRAKDLRDADAYLMGHLYERLARAYRDAMLFGIIDPKVLAAVRKKVIDHYVGGKYTSIMGYLDPQGRQPNRWRSDLQDRFRAELRAVIDELGEQDE